MSKTTNPTGEPSVTCGFFNSVVTNGKSDRLYKAEQMSSIFDGLINDGVFQSIGDALVVTAGTGNTVNVGIGKCWFNHTWTLNDAPLPIDCGKPDNNMTRIDAIVVEVNANDDKRDNFIKIVKGTASQYNPVKPTMAKSERLNQHALCYITRKPGASAITPSDIENVIGTNETPFVTGIVKVLDLAKILKQWSGQLDDFIASEESDFNAWYDDMKQLMADVTVELNNWTTAEKKTIMDWFNNIKNQLSEDAAVNLQSQITGNEIERYLVDGLPDGKKTFSDDGTVVRSINSRGWVLTKTFTNNFNTITTVLEDNEVKNYLPYPYWTDPNSSFNGQQEITNLGITFRDNLDGSITVSGTLSEEFIAGVTFVVAMVPKSVIPNGVYSVTGCPVGGSETSYSLIFSLTEADSYVKSVEDIGGGATLDGTLVVYDTCVVSIYIGPGTVCNNLIFNPKIMTVGTELGRLVKTISADGKTIQTTITNNSKVLPNIAAIEKAVDDIIATENSYIEG